MPSKCLNVYPCFFTPEDGSKQYDFDYFDYTKTDHCIAQSMAHMSKSIKCSHLFVRA